MKLDYAVRIERLAEKDGGGYVATVPDLPGCMSDGDTPEEALKNVQEAVASWTDAASQRQLNIPRPSPPRPRTATAPQTYDGGCHCGRVRFRVTASLDGVTECNCSICTKKGFLHLIVEPAQFELLSGAEALTTYRFNTGTARHTFCTTCGIHPFYVPRSDPDKIDVNVRCLDGVDLKSLDIKEFDGQHWEHAMAGRVPWR